MIGTIFDMIIINDLPNTFEVVTGAVTKAIKINL